MALVQGVQAVTTGAKTLVQQAFGGAGGGGADGGAGGRASSELAGEHTGGTLLVELGAQGGEGAEGDSGSGGRGGDAEMLGSASHTTGGDATLELSGLGGHAGRSNGSAGAAGGDAIADVQASATDSGSASVLGTVTGGDGGSSSTLGGAGGDAEVSASATSEDGAAIVDVTAVGGTGYGFYYFDRPPQSAQMGGDGGFASSTAYGSSSGAGPVSVTARARGGIAESPEEASEITGRYGDATASAEGHSLGGGDVSVAAIVESGLADTFHGDGDISTSGRDVSLVDRVSGTTTGALSLYQEAHAHGGSASSTLYWDDDDGGSLEVGTVARARSGLPVASQSHGRGVGDVRATAEAFGNGDLSAFARGEDSAAGPRAARATTLAFAASNGRFDFVPGATTSARAEAATRALGTGALGLEIEAAAETSGVVTARARARVHGNGRNTAFDDPVPALPSGTSLAAYTGSKDFWARGIVHFDDSSPGSPHNGEPSAEHSAEIVLRGTFDRTSFDDVFVSFGDSSQVTLSEGSELRFWLGGDEGEILLEQVFGDAATALAFFAGLLDLGDLIDDADAPGVDRLHLGFALSSTEAGSSAELRFGLGPAIIPEPSTALLLGLGLVVLGRRRSGVAAGR